MDPTIIIGTIISWAISLILFFIWKEKNSSWLILGHIMFLITPFIFIANEINCTLGFATGLLALCTKVIVELIMYFIPTAIIISFIIGYWIIPLFYKKSFNAKKYNSELVNKYSRILKTNIDFYLMDVAKPMAFSLKKTIFVSVGMFELLNKKELEAVILHELGHVKNNSSLSKFSLLFVRIITPLASFDIVEHKINNQEIIADAFAINIQRTDKYLTSARNKIIKYLSSDS